MTKSAHAPTPAVEDCHALLLWIIPQLDRMPRARRFTLGERLESELLAILALLVTAAFGRDRPEALAESNTRLTVCRHLWRLAVELHAISFKSYEHGALRMVHLGRQIGGWLKSVKAGA